MENPIGNPIDTHFARNRHFGTMHQHDVRQVPLHTLGHALQLWPTRRRPDAPSPQPRPESSDHDKLVHAQHLFLKHKRATARTCASQTLT